VTRFTPYEALKLITGGKLTFDGRIVLDPVVGPPGALSPTCKCVSVCVRECVSVYECECECECPLSAPRTLPWG
jgi:hypothetical protein